MSYLTPVMAFITIIFSLAIEPWHKLGETPYFDTSQHIFESCALMLLGGGLAFFMVIFCSSNLLECTGYLLDMVSHEWLFGWNTSNITFVTLTGTRIPVDELSNLLFNLID